MSIALLSAAAGGVWEFGGSLQMRKQFWAVLGELGATLLSSEDCPGASISPQDANVFIAAKPCTTSTAGDVATAMNEIDESDDEEL